MHPNPALEILVFRGFFMPVLNGFLTQGLFCDTVIEENTLFQNQKSPSSKGTAHVEYAHATAA